MWKTIVEIWTADSLLKQAWDESIEMLDLSKEFFHQAADSLQSGMNKEELKELKKRDKEINEYQSEVRKKVVTYFATHKNTADIHSGIILLNMVVDIERLGDYVKNILDLSINYKGKLESEEISADLNAIESEIKHRFDKTREAIMRQDAEKADALLKTFREDVSHIADAIVNGILQGELAFDTTEKTAAVVLYARYLKRIGSHLKNITTTIVSPYDTVGHVD